MLFMNEYIYDQGSITIMRQTAYVSKGEDEQ